MRIAKLPRKKRKELLIVFFLILGLPLLVYASYQVVQLVTQASIEAEPKNVLLTNLTTSSATISWITEVDSVGSVIPVVNGNEKSPVIDKRGNEKRKTHYVEITGLEPNTEYNFLIVSNSEKYSSGSDTPYVFRTAPVTSTAPTPNPVHGSVRGSNSDEVMIFASLKDASTFPVSSVMPRGGNWIMDLSALRSVRDKSLVVVSDTTSLVLVAVSGPGTGAFVDGTYAELFDSNGKLKDNIFPLMLTENPNLYTLFPDEALMGESRVFVDTSSTEQTSRTPSDVGPVGGGDSDSDEGDGFSETTTTTTDGRFRIVTQLPWIDMVKGDSIVASGILGEESIEVTNLGDTSFTVTWVSSEKEIGYVVYGESASSLSTEVSDERDGITNRAPYYVHSVTLNRLRPDTNYFFEVRSGGSTYDNGGSKYNVKTFPTLSSPPPFESVTGEIVNMPSHNEALVRAYIEDGDNVGSRGSGTKISTLVDERGKWILSVADSRVVDGTSYFEYTSGDSMKLLPLSTVSSDWQTESMDGITSSDILLSLGSSSSVSRQRVPILDDYGVLGFSTGVPVSTQSSYTVEEGQEIPNTGIFDNFVFLIFVSLSLLFGPLFMKKFFVTRDGVKDKMIDNI